MRRLLGTIVVLLALAGCDRPREPASSATSAASATNAPATQPGSNATATGGVSR